MVLELWYEPLQIIVNNLNNEERETYRYSWIVAMIPKKTKYVQWVVAAKCRYVVMLIQRDAQVHWRLLLGA
jgi:hypothetical protein